MKKLIPVAAVAVLAMMFTSCKKDYTCTCTSTISGTGITTTTADTKIDLGKQKKKDAESACSGRNASSTSMGITTAVSCKLN